MIGFSIAIHPRLQTLLGFCIYAIGTIYQVICLNSTNFSEKSHSLYFTSGMARKQVPLVGYLFTRLSQLGVKAVHGVPGDYNIVALDFLQDAGLEWVGDANELNAGMSLAMSCIFVLCTHILLRYLLTDH